MFHMSLFLMNKISQTEPAIFNFVPFSIYKRTPLQTSVIAALIFKCLCVETVKRHSVLLRMCSYW